MTGTLIGSDGWFPERIPPEFATMLVSLEVGAVGPMHVGESVVSWIPPTSA